MWSPPRLNRISVINYLIIHQQKPRTFKTKCIVCVCVCVEWKKWNCGWREKTLYNMIRVVMLSRSRRVSIVRFDSTQPFLAYIVTNTYAPITSDKAKFHRYERLNRTKWNETSKRSRLPHKRALFLSHSRKKNTKPTTTTTQRESNCCFSLWKAS